MWIGEFCERLGIGRETVRHYERLGLLRPARRTGNGYRDFSEEELRRIAFIRRMKAAGFSLREIGAIDRRTARSGSASRGEVVGTIDRKIAALEAEAAALEARLDNLRRFRAYIAGGGGGTPEERSFLRIEETS